MRWFFSRPKWAIHNPLKSWTLAGLSLREGQLLVASMSDAEMKISCAYCDGWSEWKPLHDEACGELFMLAEQEFQLPPVPQMQLEDDHEITEVRLALEADKRVNQRRHIRYQARVCVEILTGLNSYTTHTVNLSEGGFHFEDPIPETVAGYFIVRLQVPGERKLEFTCTIAEDQKKDKFRTEIIPANSEEMLNGYREWLKEQNFPEEPAMQDW